MTQQSSISSAKSVLLVAFHFPPVAGSSGVQRTLKFSQYLPDNGWQCRVLSVTPIAYPRTDPGQLKDIRADTQVVRAPGLDTARHLRVFGRYPGFLALPDRWISWLLGALPCGLAMIVRARPQVLWCTYPIATTHLIGWLLSRLSGVPLVADFRDSMTEENYPVEPGKRRLFRWIEGKVVRHAARCVFTTPGARQMYLDRYPDVAAERMVVIENAFDEENFLAAEAAITEKCAASPPSTDAVFRLVHSGLVYPIERDPKPLFAALKRARESGAIAAANFRLVFRASGHDAQHLATVRDLGIEDVVEFLPPLAYEQALQEVMGASGLLLLQAANCNHQIPAKVYEYFRAGRPILALTDAAGDTAGVLRENGVQSVCALDDADAIHDELLRFVEGVSSGNLRAVAADAVARNTRAARAVELARVLDLVLGERG